MSSRKDFLRHLGLLTLGTGVLPASRLFGNPAPRSRTIRILHTNDTHARLDPFPASAGSNGGLGGLARRSTLIRQNRDETPNVLLLDAGDVFQGTPYFNFYSAEPDFKAMSMMGYDAMAIGNHEFDNRVSGFMDVAPHAAFPFLCANYDFGTTPMADVVKPYIVKEIDGLKIGIFGIGVDFAGLVLASHHAGIVFRDPVLYADYYGNFLKYRERCDYVVALTHHGYRMDVDLAQKTSGIDLIIGGHSHTFLETPESYVNKVGQRVMVTQVGHSGIVLGRIDVTFDDTSRVKAAVAHNSIVGHANWDSLV